MRLRMSEMKYILTIEEDDWDGNTEKYNEVTFTSKDQLIRHLMNMVESHTHMWPTLRKED